MEQLHILGLDSAKARLCLYLLLKLQQISPGSCSASLDAVLDNRYRVVDNRYTFVIRRGVSTVVVVRLSAGIATIIATIDRIRSVDTGYSMFVPAMMSIDYSIVSDVYFTVHDDSYYLSFKITVFIRAVWAVMSHKAVAVHSGASVDRSLDT